MTKEPEVAPELAEVDEPEPVDTAGPKPAWHAPYQTWSQTKKPEDLHAVVQTLQPTIGYALASVGATNSPVLQSRALLHAAKAVQSYQTGTGASLPTWVSRQLRSLTRDAREVRSVAHVPERAQLDAVHLQRAIAEFADQHGREPDTLELADHTGMPVERIQKVRNYTGRQTMTEDLSAELPDQAPDWDAEAMEYVMHDADHIDRRIMEMRTGYGGHPIKEPNEIAAMLKITPSQMTRRAQKLTYRINAIRKNLDKLG